MNPLVLHERGLWLTVVGGQHILPEDLGSTYCNICIFRHRPAFGAGRSEMVSTAPKVRGSRIGSHGMGHGHPRRYSSLENDLPIMNPSAAVEQGVIARISPSNRRL